MLVFRFVIYCVIFVFRSGRDCFPPNPFQFMLMRIGLPKLDLLSTFSTILPALSHVTAITAEVLKHTLKFVLNSVVNWTSSNCYLAWRGLGKTYSKSHICT